MAFVSKSGVYITCISRYGQAENRYLLIPQAELGQTLSVELDETDNEQAIIKLSRRQEDEKNEGLSNRCG